MTILKVAQLGHPVLRQQAASLTRSSLLSPDTQRLIDDMIDTMREYEGVGLAAPQVHVSLRIFVAEVSQNSRYPEQADFNLQVFVNPQLEFLGAERVLGWEGCLSIADLRGEVPRCPKLRLKAWNREAKPVEHILEGFAATIVQHETDHLDGIVYLDRMPDMRSLCFNREYDRYWRRDDDGDEQGSDE